MTATAQESTPLPHLFDNSYNTERGQRSKERVGATLAAESRAVGRMHRHGMILSDELPRCPRFIAGTEKRPLHHKDGDW